MKRQREGKWGRKGNEEREYSLENFDDFNKGAKKEDAHPLSSPLPYKITIEIAEIYTCI